MEINVTQNLQNITVNVTFQGETVTVNVNTITGAEPPTGDFIPRLGTNAGENMAGTFKVDQDTVLIKEADADISTTYKETEFEISVSRTADDSNKGTQNIKFQRLGVIVENIDQAQADNLFSFRYDIELPTPDSFDLIQRVYLENIINALRERDINAPVLTPESGEGSGGVSGTLNISASQRVYNINVLAALDIVIPSIDSDTNVIWEFLITGNFPITFSNGIVTAKSDTYDGTKFNRVLVDSWNTASQVNYISIENLT